LFRCGILRHGEAPTTCNRMSHFFDGVEKG